MKKIDFNQQANRFIQAATVYQPGKSMAEIKRTYELNHIIKLASNENPLPPSKHVQQALQQAVQDNLGRYPEDHTPELRAKIANLHQVQPEQIILGNGSSENIQMLIKTFINPDDEVIISQHAFSIYKILSQLAGANIIETPAYDFGHDLQAMQDAITQKTKLVFIANPNNPTGTQLAFRDIQTFLQQVPEHIIVLIDEAYFHYADYEQSLIQPDAQNGYQTALNLLKQHPSLVVTRTFSKAYGLASLRLGYSISSEQTAQLMLKTRPSFNTNTLAITAAQAALTDKAYLQQSLDINHQGLIYLKDQLSRLGLKFIHSHTNFVLVRFGSNSMDIFNTLLQQGIIVRPTVGDQLPEFLRVSVGLPKENNHLIKALKPLL